MFNTKQNVHHSKLPKLGQEVAIPKYMRSNGQKVYRRGIVQSFNLCDNVLPYSHGIHLANVRFYDNGEIKSISGNYLGEAQYD